MHERACHVNAQQNEAQSREVMNCSKLGKAAPPCAPLAPPPMRPHIIMSMSHLSANLQQQQAPVLSHRH